VCLVGASWVRTHVLDAHPDADLTVYAIWLPMLPGDDRSAWDGGVLDDPRVVSLWDGSRIAGRWFADQRTGELAAPGDVLWDAYLAFDESAAWRGEPTGLVAAGSTIIGETSGLEDHFVPLLRS
jgi:hypothetical protein